MQKSLLIFLLLSMGMAKLSFAQYQPMAVEGAQWIIYEVFQEGSSDEFISHHNYFIQGDTVIDGVGYKKVYWRGLSNDDIGGSGNLQAPYYVRTAPFLAGVIRDVIDTREVYGVSFFEPEEILDTDCYYDENLLYDFSLTTGDTLRGCYHSGFDEIFGTTYTEDIVIDSVRMVDFRGVNYPTQYVAAPGGGVYRRLIEGVGGDNGPFTWTKSDIAFTGYLQEVVVDYCIGTDVECGLEPTGTQNAATQLGLSIYPNPTSGETLFVDAQLDCAEQLDATLYDALGRTMWQSAKLFCADFPLAIPVGGMHAGAYYLSLQGAFGVATRRVIVR